MRLLRMRRLPRSIRAHRVATLRGLGGVATGMSYPSEVGRLRRFWRLIIWLGFRPDLGFLLSGMPRISSILLARRRRRGRVSLRRAGGAVGAWGPPNRAILSRLRSLGRGCAHRILRKCGVHGSFRALAHGRVAAVAGRARLPFLLLPYDGWHVFSEGNAGLGAQIRSSIDARLCKQLRISSLQQSISWSALASSREHAHCSNGEEASAGKEASNHQCRGDGIFVFFTVAFIICIPSLTSIFCCTHPPSFSLSANT